MSAIDITNKSEVILPEDLSDEPAPDILQCSPGQLQENLEAKALVHDELVECSPAEYGRSDDESEVAVEDQTHYFHAQNAGQLIAGYTLRCGEAHPVIENRNGIDADREHSINAELDANVVSGDDWDADEDIPQEADGAADGSDDGSGRPPEGKTTFDDAGEGESRQEKNHRIAAEYLAERDIVARMAIPKPPPDSDEEWSPGRTDRTSAELGDLQDFEKYSDVDLTMMMRAGDPDAIAEFMRRNAGFINRTTYRLWWLDEEDDVRQELIAEIADSLTNDYVPGKGAQPLSFAGSIAIRNVLSKKYNTEYPVSHDLVRSPIRVTRLEGRVFAVQNHMIGTGGYVPLPDEEVERLRIPETNRDALRLAVEDRAVDGYRPLDAKEIVSIFNDPAEESNGYWFVSESIAEAMLQHVALKERMYSLQRTAPEYYTEGHNPRIRSGDEATEKATPIGEGSLESEEARTDRNFEVLSVKAVLPAALATLAPRDREILRLLLVADKTLAETGKSVGNGDPDRELTGERVRQIAASIFSEQAPGSSRGADFRRMIAKASGRSLPDEADFVNREEISAVRDKLIERFPVMGNVTRQAITAFLGLDGRRFEDKKTALEIAHDFGYSLDIINSLINSELNRVISTGRGSGQIILNRTSMTEYAVQMRQALMNYRNDPLTDDELRAWGLM